MSRDTKIPKRSVEKALLIDPLFSANIDINDPEAWPDWLREAGYNNQGYPRIVIGDFPDTTPEAKAFKALAATEDLAPETIDKMPPETRRFYLSLIGSLTDQELLAELDSLGEASPL